MKVELLKYDDEKWVAKAARLCYFKAGICELKEEMTNDKCENMINKLREMGHWSPFEHVSFTFYIEGISRACSHQLVRHRTFKFSQQSQRYVSANNFEYIIPESLENTKEYEKFMKTTFKFYDYLVEVENLKKEDARFVLPNACTTQLMVTCDARNLWHFFDLRRTKEAQWEIRNLANEMYKLVSEVAPNIFPVD